MPLFMDREGRGKKDWRSGQSHFLKMAPVIRAIKAP